MIVDNELFLKKKEEHYYFTLKAGLDNTCTRALLYYSLVIQVQAFWSDLCTSKLYCTAVVFCTQRYYAHKNASVKTHYFLMTGMSRRLLVKNSDASLPSIFCSN